MVKLTTDILKNSMPEKGKRIEMRDDDEPGLIFRVTDTGERTWSVRYRSPDGQRRKRLGTFPALSLSKAREEARKLKGAIAVRRDVVAEERAAKVAAAAKRLNTVRALGEQYFADAALGLHRPNAKPKRASTLNEERRIFDRLIEPELGDTAVSALRRGDIQAFVSKQSRQPSAAKKVGQKRGPPAVSNGRHCRNVLRQILSYAVWKEVIELNPAVGIAVVAPKVRERVLTDDEMKALWSAWERPQDYQGLALSPEVGKALQLAAVTLQRGGEVIGAANAEFDLKAKTWLIPAARMKGKRPHLVPLSSKAVEIVEAAMVLSGESPFLFPSPRSTDQAPAAIDRRSFSRAMARVCDTLEIADATPHDLRRTGATNLTSERISIPRFIVSQVIAHAGDTGGAAAVTGRHYDLNDYLPDKRRALDAWAELLMSIVTGAAQR